MTEEKKYSDTVMQMNLMLILDLMHYFIVTPSLK